MNDPQVVPTRRPQGIALTAFAAGVLSIALFVLFFSAIDGVVPYYLSLILGVAALIFGISALRKRQPKLFAVLGIVFGSLVLLVGVGLWLFALAFIGAIPSL